MAFSNAFNGRMEDLRFSSINMRPGDNDGVFSSTATNKRDSNPFYSTLGPSASEVRGSLQRRFTTDSSKLSLGRSSFNQQFSAMNSSSQAEQKQIFEDIQIARRKAQEQLALLDEKERKLQMSGPNQDVDRFASSFNRMSLNGPVSEPTTPPDYSEDIFSNRYSRSSRVSMSNITSPPGLSKRTSQASSKIVSPPGNRVSTTGLYSTHRQSTKSMPGSRRGSDEEEDYLDSLPTNRSAAALNRFSMPVNSSRISQTANIRRNAAAAMNESGLVYDDEAIHNTYSALTGGVEEPFPTLSRDGTRLSANFAAAEMANANFPENAEYAYESRVRPGHASMPHTDSSMYRPISSVFGSSPENNIDVSRNLQRHSTGLTFEDPSPGHQNGSVRPTVLQTSFSSNDVPTVKKSFGADMLNPAPHSSQAESQFHAHNVSLGRIPPGAIPNRQSREVGTMNFNSNNNIPRTMEEKPFTSMSQTTTIQANSAPFTGQMTATDLTIPGLTSPNDNFPNQPMYQFNLSNYNTNNVVAATQAFQSLPITQNYSRQDARNGKRGGQEIARLDNMTLESCRGHLYVMSKDQHGCRFMQKKLEDGAPGHVELIFNETCPHMVELMTDPFGNYLCQKLFEHCNDEQRTALIATAASALPGIALNQHGTRALQKMIEYLRTEEQVEAVIRALTPKVVELVSDLNGNHVIQKCLQVLGAERCEFVYEQVGGSCFRVGSHRHGCCVLQRCIDHAQGYQRAELVARITKCAFDLVQDAYGNYVVQYILDLDEINFTRPLCQSFRGKIVALSKQKFSSNVIEKCLRVADHETKSELIEEMLSNNELERMLRDSFANYVVQTALDYSDMRTKQRMVDAITPILPTIKQTPHGRRLASKIQALKMPPTTVPAESNFVGGRPTNRRQIQINGGGFVYGGRGFSTNQFTADDFGSTGPNSVPPIGFVPAQIGYHHGYNISNGMGNYI